MRISDWSSDVCSSDLIDARLKVPVTFNTGQVLLGFCAGVRAFDGYRDNMQAAARFLRDSLDADGCWRRHPTPFAARGEKAYETQVARSEERRVGKECGGACRFWGSTDHEKKKKQEKDMT